MAAEKGAQNSTGDDRGLTRGGGAAGGSLGGGGGAAAPDRRLEIGWPPEQHTEPPALTHCVNIRRLARLFGACPHPARAVVRR